MRGSQTTERARGDGETNVGDTKGEVKTAEQAAPIGGGKNSSQKTDVRKTKGQIRIHSENLDKTSVSKPKKIFYSTDPDLKDLKGVLKELR
jgi:hypothetical protein